MKFRRFVFIFVLLSGSVFLMISGKVSADEETNRKEHYAVLNLTGSVNAVSADYAVKAINNAAKGGAQFTVLQLDTPGGMMEPMRDIIKAILSSDVPVVVYTYPKGARAASAGAFIMLSAHVAVMAPGTEIGAMHPVSPSLDFMKKDRDGDPEGAMEKKVLNDTVAYARSLAEKQGRNVLWAEKAVRKAVSNTNSEALSLGVVDLIADDMSDLLRKLDGRKVNIGKRSITLSTSSLEAEFIAMDWKDRFLNRFADPQVIFFLLIIAVAGIWMELKNPGMIVPGALGGISLLLFLLASRFMPVNAFGVLLILLAIVLFVLEVQFISYGLLTLGGVVAFVIGSMILFDSPLAGGRLPLESIVAAVIFILAFVFLVLRLGIKAHKEQVSTGAEGMVNSECSAYLDFSDRRGKVSVHGEIWNAESDEIGIKKGDPLTVKEVRGMLLVVNRK